MKNFNLEYLADCVFIEALYELDDPFVKKAQSVMANVANGIKEHVMSMFDKDRPIASIMAFLGPGILWKLGLPWWLTVAYEVADVLGFDWIGFWDGVKNNIGEFLSTFIHSENKPSEQEMSNKVNAAVNNAAQSNIGGDDIDQEKLKSIISKHPDIINNIKSANEIRSFMHKYKDGGNYIVKEAGSFKFKLIGFFTKLISWIVKTALVSLGFAAAGGAVSSLIGKSPKDQEGRPEQEKESTSQFMQSLSLSPNTPRDFFTNHPNDTSDVWIEKSSIDNIERTLLKWIASAYPQMKQYIPNIYRSNSFRSMISKFKNRNELATGLDILAIPRPYTRKIDIIYDIVKGFVNENQNLTIEDNKENQQTPATNA